MYNQNIHNCLLTKSAQPGDLQFFMGEAIVH